MNDAKVWPWSHVSKMKMKKLINKYTFEFFRVEFLNLLNQLIQDFNLEANLTLIIFFENVKLKQTKLSKNWTFLPNTKTCPNKKLFLNNTFSIIET